MKTKRIFRKWFDLQCLCVSMLFSCGIQSGGEGNEHDTFSYYEGDNITLKQIENKIFVQSISFSDSEGFDENHWNALINSNATLRQSNNMRWTRGSFNWVVLETKDGKSTSPATIEYFKSSPLVATVSHPLETEHNGMIQGLRNEIAVKLKETTSYEQLQQLAVLNHCIIKREDVYDKNLFFVTVPKTSLLDAMKMSDLFYKTNLFESVQPNFVILNQPGISCEDKRIIKVLEDEPVFVRKRCFDHVGRTDAFCFELVNRHFDLSGSSLFPFEVIPKQYRKEGLSVYISGNVISCMVSGGCSEPNIRLAPIHLFELKSIKIKN